MSKVPILRALVNARLTAAAEEICALFERTIAEYEEELRQSREEKQENQRNQQLRSGAGVQSPRAKAKSSLSDPQIQSEPVCTEAEAEDEDEAEDAGGTVETGLISDTEALENPYSCSPVGMETQEEEDDDSKQIHDKSADAQLGSVSPKPKQKKRRGRHKRSGSALGTMRRKHQCTVCQKILKGPQSNLQRHMVIHTGERPFGCSFCDKAFTQQYLFKRHMEMHQNKDKEQEEDKLEEVPSQAEQVKGTQTGANQTLKTESEDGAVETFPCSLCEKKFKRQVALKKHLESHEVTKEQLKKLRKEAQVAQSEPQVHVKEQEEVLALDSENGKDVTPATLMKSMHAASAGEACHRCSICHRAFTTRTRLKRHMIVHTGDKPFSCPVCNKCFSQKYNVRLHMAVHTDERPFSCDLCLKSYRRNDDLRTHMSTHTGQVLFSCVVCNMAFKQRNCLATHMRLHTGDRPYRCPMCTKTFIQKSNLNRHVRSHTGEKPFRCPVCPQRFVQRSDIRKHMAIHA
ncbi:uncharacterized protein [Eucyclogobius newberryi]|uniref:uncharacterized protein n=1 Tax=Eucyclogobius newberryi TaxID=166745 RepID=UPI003B593D7F